ncbi:hypothetical protein AQ505_14265 [Pedobacter sp. PACM 27299]|nr:hypothetical protein AQ505_14265 [Pedobacter sp. PACM 27299]
MFFGINIVSLLANHKAADSLFVAQNHIIYKKIVIFVLKSNIFKLVGPQVLFSVFMILALGSFSLFDKFVKLNRRLYGRNY